MNRNSHSLLVRIQNGTGILEDSLTISYKTKHTPYNPAVVLYVIYPKKLKSMFAEKPITDVYSSFIHNCQNLEENRCTSVKWMDTVTVLQLDNGNELSSHEKTWRNFKCILLSERSQFEKATYWMIPTRWHSGKSRSQKKINCLQAAGVEGERKCQRTEFEGGESSLYNMMTDVWHYAFVQTHRCTFSKMAE